MTQSPSRGRQLRFVRVLRDKLNRWVRTSKFGQQTGFFFTLWRREIRFVSATYACVGFEQTTEQLTLWRVLPDDVVVVAMVRVPCLLWRRRRRLFDYFNRASYLSNSFGRQSWCTCISPYPTHLNRCSSFSLLQNYNGARLQRLRDFLKPSSFMLGLAACRAAPLKVVTLA